MFVFVCVRVRVCVIVSFRGFCLGFMIWFVVVGGGKEGNNHLRR